MVVDEKDRLGDKLRDVERAREDLYFAERDRKLLEQLRQAKAGETEATLKELTRSRCPKTPQFSRLGRTFTAVNSIVQPKPACRRAAAASPSPTRPRQSTPAIWRGRKRTGSTC